VGELLVCADLLSRGHEVFRAVNQQCPYDLVVEINRVLYRVEVKAGRIRNYALRYTDLKRGKRPEDIDILAVVLSPTDIRYKPPLERFENVTQAVSA